VLTLLSAVLVLQTPAEDAKKAIEVGYARWSKAFIVKDFKVIEELTSKDFVMVSTVNGEKKNAPRDRFVGNIKKQFDDKNFKVTRFDIKIEKVETTKDGWLATIEERFTYELNGKEYKAGQRTADGWKKSDKGWQVTSTELIERLKL
jgi:ketosteroid isomerase-like protein